LVRGRVADSRPQSSTWSTQVKSVLLVASPFVLRLLSRGVDASLSSADSVSQSQSAGLGPPPSSELGPPRLASSAVLQEVKMFAIATATAALIAFSATAEAATSKYDYGGREKYKHEYRGSYKPYYKHGAYEREHMRGDSGYDDYNYEPSYASPYADQEYSFEASVSKKVKRSSGQAVEEGAVEEGAVGEARQSLSKFNCCRRLEVRSAPNWPQDKGITKLRPDIFGMYNLVTGLINGRDHWVSDNGKKGIWIDGDDDWVIGDYNDLGSGVGAAFVPDSRSPNVNCPEDIEFGKWMYFVRAINIWLEAEDGVKVFCLF